MTQRDRMPTPFISIDGLAGDVAIMKEAVQKREATISSLEKELKRLDTSHEKEAKKIYTKQKATEGAIERQIKALQQQLEQQLAASSETTRKEIATLNSTYEAREQPYLKRIKALGVLNTLDRGRIAPIRKLPAELLGYSFQHCVDLEQSPWLLTMVSKSWKQTAITTPGLWVHISFTQAERCEVWQVDGKVWYSRRNRVVCRTLEELNVITRYAGSLPLDVVIPWYSVREQNIDMFQVGLDGGAISRRLGALTIERGSAEYGQPGLKKQEIGVFPNLHTISLCYLPPGMYPAIFETTSSSMPRLRHLEVRSSITLPLDSSLWSRLQTLDLGMQSNRSDLNLILPHLTLVEELRGCPGGWPDSQTPNVKLEHLKVLDVTCDHLFLSSLLLPSLEQLTVDDTAPRRYGLNNRYAADTTLSLPAFITLTAKSEDPTVWLSRLAAPLLRTISLGGKIPLPLFENMEFSNVESFSLDAPCSDEVLISALRRAPNAKEILLAPGPTRERLWGFGTLQALAKEPDEICPNMHTFTLGTTDHRVQLSKSLANPWIRKIIKARPAMSGFEVHWSFRGGKEESVQYVG